MKRILALLSVVWLLSAVPHTLAETVTEAATGTPLPTESSAESPTATVGTIADTDQTTAANGQLIDIEITDDNYLMDVTEIGGNAAPYLGKIIALDGMFTTVSYGEGGPVYHLVYRQSPSCCGNEGFAGFEVIWDDPNAIYPAENDWVRAVGVLEQYLEDGMAYLQLRLISLDVLPERGEETVSYNDPSGVQIPLY